jgi:hypothetical protein
MWKSRKNLPALLELDYKFDIDKLVIEYIDVMNDRPWDAYENEYANLKETWTGITHNSDWKNDTSSQMALTVYDPDYTIRENRNSGSKWDYTYYKNDQACDGRSYSKLKNDLPPYFSEVIDFFTPHRERVILSKLYPTKSLGKHVDHDSLLSIRFHIALQTNEDCFMCFEDSTGIVRQHIPADGKVWFLNPGLPHWVENNGDMERTHLIINMDSQRLIQ